MKISNYLRYIIVTILLSLLFYSYTMTIEKEIIKEAIHKKMPIVIDKKGFVVTLNDIHIENISANVVESKLIGTFKVNNLLKKLLKKSINLTIVTKTTPKLHGADLSFELLSLNINELIKMKEIKGLLKKKIENIKIPIKKLKNISWFSSVQQITFKDDGDLEVDVMFSKLIIVLLIPLLLLREIGLFFIVLYQKFLSPRKKYKCAKGELHQNGTCSSTTKEAFKKDGFIAGMKEYSRSTKECKQADKIIKEKNKNNKQNCTDLGCSGCSGFTPGSSLGACEIGMCASSPCDVASC